KIEVSVRLVADFAGKCHNWRNFPVEASAGPNLAICQDRVIQPRDSVRVPEIVRHTVTGLLHVRPYVQRYISAHLKLQTRSWQHGIEKPLRGNFPANSSDRNNRVFPLDIDTDAEDELQIGTVNVGAADEEREIETVPSQIIELSIVHAGLTFRPHDN